MITWDEAKRAVTLAERGLDFADAAKVFAHRNFTFADERFAYGEARFITAGYLDDRFVVIVWTWREGAKRIISMRYGHAKEERQYQDALG
ncbi:BrnT family toxin [Magnetospirillum moscoviense]|uniref:BrnT family toxin n=1 Tax=Magnetospirillum moscoviense TaxID=1437059 RepID=A0A178MPD9_9PROT|nr:BrnT family toxin [Magnetospirillum moscoviense]OAN49988.1 hypothetical protein A6A05_01885 [Magnetospirillum moscoviense]